jgi:hypothetical protein
MQIVAPLAAPVSTGFAARALERLTHRLAVTGFDEVLCGDETPTTVISARTPTCGLFTSVQDVWSPNGPQQEALPTPRLPVVLAPSRSMGHSIVSTAGEVDCIWTASPSLAGFVAIPGSIA